MAERKKYFNLDGTLLSKLPLSRNTMGLLPAIVDICSAIVRLRKAVRGFADAACGGENSVIDVRI